MKHTIANLRLNLEEARKGRTWLLLPPDFESRKLAQEYPLPTDIEELQQVASIPMRQRERNSGSVYIKRAQQEWVKRMGGHAAAALRIEDTAHRAYQEQNTFQTRLKRMQADAQKAVDQVKERADEAMASLDSLFGLTKRGFSGILEAHLTGGDWQGEKVSVRTFIQCANIIHRSVKGLGLPTKDDSKARDTVIAEAAASLKARQEALAMQESAADEEKPTN